jgi:hypothetical protein
VFWRWIPPLPGDTKNHGGRRVTTSHDKNKNNCIRIIPGQRQKVRISMNARLVLNTLTSGLSGFGKPRNEQQLPSQAVFKAFFSGAAFS